jgi:hypothetical protein
MKDLIDCHAITFIRDKYIISWVFEVRSLLLFDISCRFASKNDNFAINQL